MFLDTFSLPGKADLNVLVIFQPVTLDSDVVVEPQSSFAVGFFIFAEFAPVTGHVQERGK